MRYFLSQVTHVHVFPTAAMKREYSQQSPQYSDLKGEVELLSFIVVQPARRTEGCLAGGRVCESCLCG